MWNVFMIVFGIGMGILLFISSIFRKIEFLKKISMLGIVCVFYNLGVLAYRLAQYYNFYYDKIFFTDFILDSNVFETIGICIYLFLNQYTVVPICNDL